jgi:hypothetical protein
MTAAEFFEVAPPVAAVASNEPVERVTAEAMDGNRRKGATRACPSVIILGFSGAGAPEGYG